MQALASQLQNAASITPPTNGMDSPDRLKTDLDSRCNALTYLKASLNDHKRAVDTIFDFMEPECKRKTLIFLRVPNSCSGLFTRFFSRVPVPKAEIYR